MSAIRIQYYNTKFGELILGSFDDDLVLCDWRYRKARAEIDHRIKYGLRSDYIEKSSEVIKYTKLQLQQYMNKEIKNFKIPIRFIGTEFQQSVWNTLQTIPYGETWTYLKLAKQMKNADAIRAVAAANGANAISIIVPCHRIIGSDGSLTGYAGGIHIKKKLLTLENAIEDSQLNLFSDDNGES